jgi:exodeoxyribonuclease VII large subunit
MSLGKNKKMLPILTPSQFVAVCNQTMEMAFPIVEIEGEVTNFKISKNRWVYFDIADDEAKLRCFGTVYILPAPLEDGMQIRIVAVPKLHQQFGFSLTIQSIQFSGEGTIKKAADLLFEKLQKEGLFSEERKRQVPYPPQKIGLVASAESAGYKDFIKILGERYGGLDISLADVTVQGESAPMQIVRAIEWFNRASDIPDVLVIIRGGGSADDLQAFSTEQVTRAVAASRIPTVVAIGHEVDVSLAELAADMRASTPSNAAELLVPDRRDILSRLDKSVLILHKSAVDMLDVQSRQTVQAVDLLHTTAISLCDNRLQSLVQLMRTLEALSPEAILKRGYAIVRKQGKVIRSAKIDTGTILDIRFADGVVQAKVQPHSES